jgi:hypothetical protein
MPSASRGTKGINQLVGSAAAALLSARPELSIEEAFAGLFRAALSAAAPPPVPSKGPTARQRSEGPVEASAARGKAPRCTQCSHPPAPGLKHCRRCLKKARARTRRWEIKKAAAIARRAAKPRSGTGKKRTSTPSVTSIASARKAKQREPPRQPPSPSRARGGKAVPTTFTGGKKAFFKALDHANDGVVSKLLDLLDNGSPYLRDLAESFGRGPRSRSPIRTWAQAIDALTPGNAYRWRDVNLDRMKRLSDAMRGALEAGGGGVTNASRSGVAFAGLRLPVELENLLEQDRWAAEGEGDFAHARVAVG